MDSIIEVSGLSKSYHKNTVLNTISFQVHSGETVALLGENGAGKSTLILLLNQLIPKDSGAITIMGSSRVGEIREKIGFMMQQNLSLNRITVKECLNLTRSYYQRPLSYDQLILLADLKQEENQYLDRLSGGQGRRLTFAAAMAGDPQLVFLDEPTAGMDSSSRKSFWQSVAALKKSGKTFFVTSHYLEELEYIADRIMILKETHLVYDGSLQDLRKRKGSVSIQFATKLSQALFTQLAAVKETNVQDERIQLITDEPNLVLEELVPYLDQIESLHVQQNSLESLFNDVIGGTDK